MQTIQHMIGKRFEDLLQEWYPALQYVGDERNVTPDFRHSKNPVFFAEAKTAFNGGDFGTHIKRYQVDSFREIQKIEPVIYLFGFHDFAHSTRILAPLGSAARRRRISKNMDIVSLFIIDNEIVSKIWGRRHYVNEKGHIEDCTLRRGHLQQIINDSRITVQGKEFSARDYYKIASENYDFSPLKPAFGELQMAHAIKKGSEEILYFFYRKN